MRRNEAVIACEDLGRSFGVVEVVKHLDLSIGAGTIVGLIGPSGCGKTTTVRLLTGLLDPRRAEPGSTARRPPHLTSRQREEIGYRRRRTRLRQLLQLVEIDGDRRKRVREASGGMRRRLALAAAFVHWAGVALGLVLLAALALGLLISPAVADRDPGRAVVHAQPAGRAVLQRVHPRRGR